jgi:hypothetical protein
MVLKVVFWSDDRSENICTMYTPTQFKSGFHMVLLRDDDGLYMSHGLTYKTLSLSPPLSLYPLPATS